MLDLRSCDNFARYSFVVQRRPKEFEEQYLSLRFICDKSWKLDMCGEAEEMIGDVHARQIDNAQMVFCVGQRQSFFEIRLVFGVIYAL